MLGLRVKGRDPGKGTGYGTSLGFALVIGVKRPTLGPLITPALLYGQRCLRCALGAGVFLCMSVSNVWVSVTLCVSV